MVLGGNITIGDANTDLINVNAQFKNSLIPFDDNSYDLGTSIKKWKNIFLSGTFDNSTNTGALILPQGTDAERPGSPAVGMLRFSTTNNKAEVYNGTAWVEVGTTPPVNEAFKTIAVSGQTSIVADQAEDTLTFVAGTGITITTDATTDEITITGTGSYSNSDVDAHLNTGTAQTNQVLSWDGSDYNWVAQSGGGGGTQNLFDKIAVSGQSNIVADNTSDTLTLVAGTGITITTNATTDEITITGTSSYGNNDVDTHLNQSTAATGEVLSWNGSDYDWVSNAGYTDADVDTHLNLSTATTGQALIYNGSDYSWGTVGCLLYTSPSPRDS